MNTEMIKMMLFSFEEDLKGNGYGIGESFEIGNMKIKLTKPLS